MILINTHTDEGYSNVSKAMASRMIGCSERTIYEWQNVKQFTVVKRGKWTIYLNETRLKVNQNAKINHVRPKPIGNNLKTT